jgi:hypothetical protein
MLIIIDYSKKLLREYTIFSTKKIPKPNPHTDAPLRPSRPGKILGGGGIPRSAQSRSALFHGSEPMRNAPN